MTAKSAVAQIDAVLAGESDGCIVCGDCLEVMAAMPDGCVDAVVTDPPYGIGKAAWDNRYPFGCEEEFFRLAISVFVMPGPAAIPQCVATMGGRYRGIIAAHNRNGMTYSPLGFGNWIPIVVGGACPRGQDAFDFVVAGDKPDHPSPKPLAAIEWLIQNKTNPGDIILAPFCGSGTTCVAAKKLGRWWIGIEINERYCEIARARVRDTEKPLFDPSAPVVKPIPHRPLPFETEGRS